jgi:serine/threonine protein kinase
MEKLERSTEQTGSDFSVGYIVLNPSGARAFCKALDCSAAFAHPDPSDAVEQVAKEFSFERDLLHKCKNRGMDRVVRVLDSGTLRIDPDDDFSVVQFLIFELGDGDIRKTMKFAQELDVATALRTLHHVSNGLRQLHEARVAHQDLKPSNVMTFGSAGSKVGDLGRATDSSQPMPHDEITFADARKYAPPELLYREVAADWGVRRAACDLYLLGSLAMFMFTGVGMTARLKMELPATLYPQDLGGPYSGTYRDVLPQVRSAFAVAMEDLDASVPEDFRAELGAIVRCSAIRTPCSRRSEQ